MGIFIDYNYRVVCTEADLLGRLNRLRERLLTLPFESVSPVIAVEPAYRSLYLSMLRDHGGRIPDCVSERVAHLDRNHGDLCHLAAPVTFLGVPEESERRFWRPALDFCRTTPLWRADDLPERVSDGYGLTLCRAAFELEFASVMLRHGHLIHVRPCEGCETFAIGLTRFRGTAESLWLGGGFCKTQYAARFVRAHEGICTALDFADAEGLLLSANDTCGFYGHRDWSRSAGIVNAEATAAKTMGDLFRLGIEHARQAGLDVRDVSSPATRNHNSIRAESKRNGGRNR